MRWGRRWVVALMLVAWIGAVPGQEARPGESRPRTDDDSLRHTWLLGKIEPAVESLWRAGGDLHVFLYLEATPVEESVAEARSRNAAEVRSLSDELRRLEGSYRPEGSLTEDEEKLLAPWLRLAYSQEDLDRRHQLNLELDRQLTLTRSRVLEVMKQRGAASQAVVSDLVEARGGTVLARIHSVNAIEALIPAAALLDIAADPLVWTVIAAREASYELDNSVPSVGFDTWHADGLTGGGQWDAGVIDSGIQTNHPYFADVTIVSGGSSLTETSETGHGTHVAGIIASRDSTYKGTAHNLGYLFVSYADTTPFVEFDNLMDSSVTGVDDAPDVINYSQGLDDANDTDYSTTDAFFDAFVENFDTMITKSAGNNGWGTTTITHPGPAYNIIVVANMDDQNSGGRGDDVRRDSSSVGPTLGGRKKPDITAPGTNIRSANAFFEDVGTCNTCGGTGTFGNTCGKDFCEASGTSMAAPHVAGAVVLMQQGGNVNPESQKAVLLNTADAWTSNNSSGTGDDGEVSGSYWDKSYGWGYLDMDEAHFNRADYFVDSLVPDNANGTDDDYKLYAGTMFADEKATLVWTKRSLYGAVEIPEIAQFDLSNLDLYLFDAITGAQVGQSTSTIDNVEQVAVSADTSAVLKVMTTDTSFDGPASSEEFALATEEGFVQVSPLANFSSEHVGPATMDPGTQADLSAYMVNDNIVGAFNNYVALQPLPPGWSRISGAPSQPVGHAGPGEATNLATWRFQARPADTQPPTPSALPWAVAPYDIGRFGIEMTASVATDPHGPVEYFFDFLTSPTGGTGGADSGWQTDTTFTATGLQANHQYCYRVAPRDGLPVVEKIMFTHGHTSYGEPYGPAGEYGIPVILSETPNVGSGSPTECTFTAIGASTGVAAATGTATSLDVRSINTPAGLDRGTSGIRFFNNTAGTMSGWRQHNDPWTSGSLQPNTAYEFQALTRNGDGDETELSAPVLIATRAMQPAAGGFATPTNMAIEATWSANGNPAGTEYLAENTTNGTSSGWTTALTWTDVGLTCGTPYTFRVKARNLELVETAWVSLGIQSAGFDYDGDALANCVDPDDDNDGTADESDCLPLNATTWSTPGETGTLLAEHTGGVGGSTTLSWQAPSDPGTNTDIVYDTLLSSSVGPWQPGTTACFEQGTDLTSVHSATPAPGVTLYFLTRAENYCGDGDAGGALTLPTCACDHGICTEGVALDPGCHPCAATLCAADPFCCDEQWDAICVQRVGLVCELSCE